MRNPNALRDIDWAAIGKAHAKSVTAALARIAAFNRMLDRNYVRLQSPDRISDTERTE